MSYQFCSRHNKVTAWGCPICRRELMEAATAEAVEQAAAAFRNELQSQTKVKATLRLKEISHD